MASATAVRSKSDLPETGTGHADIVTYPSLFPALASAIYQSTPTYTSSLLSHQQTARHLDTFLVELVDNRDGALTALKDLSASEQTALGVVTSYISKIRALCLDWKDQQVREQLTHVNWFRPLSSCFPLP